MINLHFLFRNNLALCFHSEWAIFFFDLIVRHCFRINERKSSSPSGQQQMTDDGASAQAQNMLHSCSFCGKSFSHSKNLKRHMRIHTEKGPYSCSMCTKLFTKRENLKKHIRTHTRPFVCSLCSKTSGKTFKKPLLSKVIWICKIKTVWKNTNYHNVSSENNLKIILWRKNKLFCVF